MQNEKILLVALNAKFYHTNLAVRSIKAYCNNDNIEILEMSINDHFEDILENIMAFNASLVAFSCYIWNIELILKLANCIKKINSAIKTMLGGSEVTYDCQDILEKHNYIDIIMYGAGELAFKKLANNLSALDKVPSIFYRDGNEIISTSPAPFISLNDIPFVYDVKKLPAAPYIIYYESSRGCPYSCGFCLSGTDNKVDFLEESRTIKELTQMATAGANQIKLVDRTFNANVKRAKNIWEALSNLPENIKTNFHFEISAQLIDDESLQILKKAPVGRFQFEIGIQSTNKQTLTAITRVDNFDSITHVVKEIKSFGNIHVHVDLIAGLPFEDMDSFKRSFNEVFALRAHMFQLGFLKLLKGSALRTQAEEYGIVYNDAPPYRVLKTQWISFDELCKLEKIEKSIDVFYHSLAAENSIEYILSLRDNDFQTFSELIEYSQGSCKPQYILQRLYNYAEDYSILSSFLAELMQFDWLAKQKRGFLLFNFELTDEQKYKIKSFYKFNAASVIDIPKDGLQSSWRFCHIHIFQYDILHYFESKEVIKRENAILFDYVALSAKNINL